MLVQRRSLGLAVSLIMAGMLSSCWCSAPPGSGPEGGPVAPVAGESPANGIGNDGLQDSPPTLASAGGSPTPTPATFIVRVPAADATLGPDSTPPLEEILRPTAVPRATQSPLVTPSPVPGATPLPLTPWPTPTRRPALAPVPAGAAPVGPVTAPTPAASGEVGITLDASPAMASVGQQVSVSVAVQAGPGRPVDAVQVYLDFDAAVLEVVSLSGSTALSQELQSSFDNNLGRVNYAAGTLENSIQAPFTLVTVVFQAISRAGPGSTDIAFAPLLPPRQTRVAVGPGVDTTGDLAPVQVVVQ